MTSLRVALLVMVASLACHAALAPAPSVDSPQAPLMLTPMLEAGRLEHARALSQVHVPGMEDTVSFSGYLTVDKDLGNHLFFWYFRSPEDPEAPLVIWLDGGPGESSMMGLLHQHGPIQPDGVGGFTRRPTTWVGPFSVLYIDSPVGTGFSYSDSGAQGFRITQEGFTNDLYQFVVQFYVLFPEVHQRDLYVGGSSYAGKYAPALAHKIHIEQTFPLKGVYLGGPFYDPETMMPAFFDHFYSIGFISHGELNLYKQDIHRLLKRFADNEIDGETLATTLDVIIPIDIRPRFAWIGYNEFVVDQMLSSDIWKTYLHAGTRNTYTVNSRELFDSIAENVFVGTKPLLAELMDNYKVLLYNGDHDDTVSTSMIEAALTSTPWSMKDAYNNSTRTRWGTVSGDCTDNSSPRTSNIHSNYFQTDRYSDLDSNACDFDTSYRGGTSNQCDNYESGYFTFVGNFCRVIIKGAGHQCGIDRPEALRDVMKGFISSGCVGHL